MTPRELRTLAGISQAEAAAITGIPLRTYKNYENDQKKIGTIKYEHIIRELEKFSLVDESHGILSVEKIKEACGQVLSNYNVQYCILFGSYAKGTATPNSDVDLIVATSETGIRFFAMAEELRVALKKKVDLLDLNQLSGNPELLKNILLEGEKVYVQNQ